MNNKILDEGFLGTRKVTNKEEVKQALREAGINSFYEHKNGNIIVKKGDAIQLEIYFENGSVVIKEKFPRIGNSVQVVVSGVILAIFLFVILLPFPMQWIVAIIGGQLFSYFFFKPKTRDLKKRIESYLGINYMT
ncbi:MAG: hypothetical protein DWQ02_00860 [Bacteroidetes bacterium]|nr:MAG: hypothetical protein DWQ02_00860 [Bacteroidota bacterium]